MDPTPDSDAERRRRRLDELEEERLERERLYRDDRIHRAIDDHRLDPDTVRLGRRRAAELAALLEQKPRRYARP